MSLITYRTKNVKRSAASGRTDRALTASPRPTIAGLLRKSVASLAKLLMQAVDAIAEARMQRAAIEAELYFNRYRHSSKNDDDLPIVR